MKNIVIQQQEDNWGDDGGMHDAFAITVSDADYATLLTYDFDSNGGRVINSAEHDDVDNIIENASRPTMPCMIEKVISIWFGY